MNKHNLSGIFFAACTLLCLNIGQAQTTTPPTEVLTNTLNSIQPIPPTAAPIGTQPAGAAGTPATGPTPTSPTSNIVGKYEEHQSICRLNEYDQVKDFSKELKERRVALLQNRLKADTAQQKPKTQLRLIKEYLDQKDTKNALALIQEMKKQKLNAYDNEFLNALAAIAENRISTARQTLNKMSLETENASNVELLRTLAELYMTEENFYEASTLYEDLNALTKNSYLPQQCESLVLNTMNADAEKVCLQAANRFPKNPFPHIYIGITHRERMDFKKAGEAFKKSLSIQPTEMGHTCMAELNFMNKNYPEAVKEYKKAVELNPNSNRAILGLAWTEVQTKNFTEALAAFQKSCKISSKNEMEVRKAYKILNDEKDPNAPRFAEVVNRCSGPN